MAGRSGAARSKLQRDLRRARAGQRTAARVGLGNADVQREAAAVHAALAAVIDDFKRSVRHKEDVYKRQTAVRTE